MHSPSKRLVTASVVNLVSNGIGIVVAPQNNLTSDLGGSLHGQNVYQDFLTTQGTPLSAPVPFMVIQLVLTLLVLRPGRLQTIGTVGLSLVGLLYTLAPSGERILIRLLTPGSFDLLQTIIFFVNGISAVAMLVLGIRAWRTRLVPEPVTS